MFCSVGVIILFFNLYFEFFVILLCSSSSAPHLLFTPILLSKYICALQMTYKFNWLNNCNHSEVLKLEK